MSTQRTALIVGGTRGLGAAVARRLAVQGAVGTLFLNYLDNDRVARQLRTELETLGVQTHLLKANMAFPEAIEVLFDTLGTHTQRLDYFVFAAAVTAFKPLHGIRANQWDLTFNVSTRAFLLCARHCLPLMTEGGSIVAISSTGAHRFNPNYGALGVAKAALESTVQYLAAELGHQGIRVNGVVPGLIAGEQLPPFPDIRMVVDETLRRTPAGRLGTPDDIARVAAFVLTEADWMLGQNLIVDGGYCLT
ncbi:MAG TPA: SDR family oxidoreductase [Saprospiraceae bacterium]|nr:SDR family oxidoreductase [Saprospiraceae bacterium]HND88255.1 SDR family oxidoreductase [Saprospiraceae bacterium]HNG89379.1 SDR family oxidoreductase [Saprospiraceae bacterium]